MEGILIYVLSDICLEGLKKCTIFGIAKRIWSGHLQDTSSIPVVARNVQELRTDRLYRVSIVAKVLRCV